MQKGHERRQPKHHSESGGTPLSLDPLWRNMLHRYIAWQIEAVKSPDKSEANLKLQNAHLPT